MLKNINEESIETGFDFLSQAGVLLVGFAISATALAPFLPPDVKQKINESASIDLDATHHHVKEKLMGLAKIVGRTLADFNGSAQHKQPDKCKAEQTVNIGGWVFTIPNNPKCL